MSAHWLIPRNCLAWILVAQLALIAPHAQRLPWWVLGAYGLCALWRIMVYQGRWSFAPRIMKVVLSLLCVLGTWRSYGTIIGLEPTVALLFSGFCLKLLELSKKRDVYVIIYLGFFVALTAFLFSQSFTMALYMLFTAFLLCTALVALHQQDYNGLTIASSKKAAMILLQAVPIMLVLFLVFPRFDPLWKVPLPSHQAKTGISDTLSPGDISQLSQSGELAFRVVFDSDIPSRQTMYWRGLVMSDFDGRSWRQGGREKSLLSSAQTDELLKLQNKPLRYSVIQEPTYQPWLFSLALAYSNDPSIYIASDFRLVRNEDVFTRIKYSVLSTPSAVFGRELSTQTFQAETRLPRESNPEARAYAEKLFNESADTEAYIQRILRLFSQEGFYYTLNPPLLGEHVVDEFLFSSRRGFCSHYASSFVFLMRAAGIPARVVVGYQGGEINPITGTVLVHQFDAHSWAEVWLADQGWVRVDPTAAVAPNRIEFGLERALFEEGSFLADEPLSPLRYRNVQWMNQLRLQLDALNYYWTSWVLQYKDERQLRVLESLLGKVSPWRLASFILVVGAIALALVAYGALKGRGRQPLSAEVKAYLQLCRHLEKAGFKRQRHEAPIDFAARIRAAQPTWYNHLQDVTDTFTALSYEQVADAKKQALLEQLRSQISQLVYQLRKSP